VNFLVNNSDNMRHKAQNALLEYAVQLVVAFSEQTDSRDSLTLLYLNKSQRHQIHQLAERLKLDHKTIDQDANQPKIVISKQVESGAAPVKLYLVQFQRISCHSSHIKDATRRERRAYLLVRMVSSVS